ncbi:MAG: metal ABC transporter ATP-binding protein [Elusimicrobiota bacterium]|nr:metal ABC transporter ATP-binding protein [Elusimicrobiota bacterium]
MALIQCVDLSFAYNGNTVLSDVNFSVQKGDYICIVGANGSGKSTLIKGILGLKKQSNGEIIFGDGLKSADVGYIPQQNAIQKNFPANVYEIVASGRLNKCGLRPFYNKQDKKIIDENLNLFGIENLKHKSFSELSGGQQQKVLLARALCSAEKLLILDEPASSLDPSAAADLYALLKKINDKSIAIIIVSHDLTNSFLNSKKVLHLENKQIFFGSVEDYIKSDTAQRFMRSVKNV